MMGIAGRRAAAMGLPGTALACAVLAAPALAAGTTSPFGLWKPGEDETGTVRLYEQSGRLFGRIETVDPADEGKLCTKCPDERRGKPLKGLVFLRNLTPTPDGTWAAGDVLDPTSGKIYSVQLKVAPGGETMGLRGYVGNPLFGLTRTWYRLPDPAATKPAALPRPPRPAAAVRTPAAQ